MKTNAARDMAQPGERAILSVTSSCDDAPPVYKKRRVKKYNEEIVRKVINLYQTGEHSQRNIAGMLEIPYSTVQSMITGKSWKSVTVDRSRHPKRQLLSKERSSIILNQRIKINLECFLGWMDYIAIIPVGDSFAVIDEDDYEKIIPHKWHLTSNYASTTINGKHFLMHRLILGLDDPKIESDHIDFDTLNNRKCNLRKVNHLQNSQYRRKKTNYKESSFKGVRFKGKSWYARITVNSKEIHLGVFKTEAEAVIAYDRACLKHFGEFARPNFNGANSQ